MKVDDIKVISACNEPWEQMKGDSRSRHCESCQFRVHNLEAMTRAEIERLLKTPGRVCGRVAHDEQGRLLTADPVETRSRLGWAALLALATACHEGDSSISPSTQIDPTMARQTPPPNGTPIPEVPVQKVVIHKLEETPMGGTHDDTFDTIRRAQQKRLFTMGILKGVQERSPSKP
jgi:hypothetical protein